MAGDRGDSLGRNRRAHRFGWLRRLPAVCWAQVDHPHPAIDDGAEHRPALIGTRGKRLGVDALQVEMTTEACIVGEGVSNVLLRDGVLGARILVVTHQESASQVPEQVTFGVRVITE